MSSASALSYRLRHYVTGDPHILMDEAADVIEAHDQDIKLIDDAVLLLVREVWRMRRAVERLEDRIDPPTRRGMS